MKVICAGLPKTGTKSLAAALRLLDYNVYDFPEQASYCMKEFIEALNVGLSEEDWREVLKGVERFREVLKRKTEFTRYE